MKTFETRHDIKARIMREAAREWGFKGVTEIDLNAFDPFIDLMMGACAFELEKLSHEILNSRKRIFDRLVQVLTPDVLSSAQPGHAIMHGAPIESTYTTKKEDQFFCKSNEHKKDFFFAPLDEYKLFDAKIEQVAYNDKIYKINERHEKELVGKSDYGLQLNPSSYYIGIKTNPYLRSLKDFTLYFDWKNEVLLNDLLQYLSTSKWYIGDHELKKSIGYNRSEQLNHSNTIIEALGFNSLINRNVHSRYKPHFITIQDDEVSLSESKTNYPAAFNRVFDETILATFESELLWIEMVVPSFLHNYMDGMQCLLNCFPIVNRKLVEKQDKLVDNLHILPLELLGEYFVGIENVANSAQVSYAEIAMKDVDNADYGMYALRSNGVKRFDDRDAKEMMDYLMGLLGSESSAFKGVAYSALASDFMELEQTFARIKKNVNLSSSEVESEYFLFAKPFLNDPMIYVKYWTSDGEKANGLPRNTLLKLHNNSNFQANTSMLVTSTMGGTAPKQNEESIHQFKEVVLRRNRIVTKQDVKKMCIQELGSDNIQSIAIEKGILLDKSGHNGLRNCLFIYIERYANSSLSLQDFQMLCIQVERKLNDQSMGVYPIKIKLNDPVVA